MATYVSDSEIQQFVDRVRCVAYREAMDSGADFICKKWIAKKIKRSDKFVQRCWKKPYDELVTQSRCGAPEVLSPASKEVIWDGSAKKRKSCTEVARDIKMKRGKVVSRQLVHNYRVREGLKAWHIIPRPLKNESQKADRLWFINFLRDWDEDDFLHLAPSDEFFVYTIRKPNHQNDRVWAKRRDDCSDLLVREQLAWPQCIGIFLLFTAKKMMWIIKDDG
ncbi:unnamed protein product [Owenia fusiformis]|uniref:Uncharacterized protein n=1 Tax=Owenia fusiformis TaxID=6347 RepID=A0A8J1TVL5_OWEFU|nr:unnamed protein product [Owenia fusiformis]